MKKNNELIKAMYEIMNKKNYHNNCSLDKFITIGAIDPLLRF